MSKNTKQHAVLSKNTKQHAVLSKNTKQHAVLSKTHNSMLLCKKKQPVFFFLFGESSVYWCFYDHGTMGPFSFDLTFVTRWVTLTLATSAMMTEFRIISRSNSFLLPQDNNHHRAKYSRDLLSNTRVIMSIWFS